jgi:hypothetical protein
MGESVGCLFYVLKEEAMIRKILNVTLSLALFIIVTPPSNAMVAQPSQVVRLGLTSPINQLDPLFVENSSEAVLAKQLFLGLVKLDMRGNLIPDLAQSWEVSDDGLTWTFFLRPGIPWVNANREPVRDVFAEDVQFTIIRALEFGNFEEILQGVEVLDDFTIQLFLRAPNPDFGTVLAVSPAAKVVPFDLAQEAGDAWTQPGVIWGAGPYLLVERTDLSVVLEANPFWEDEASIQARTVQVEFTPDPREALQRYLHDELDLIELPPEFRDVLVQEPGLAEQVRDIEGTPLDLLSQAPFTRLVGVGHSYLVKQYLQPVYSTYFGLSNFHLWGFDNRIPEVQIPGTTRVLNDETLSALRSMTDDQSMIVFERMTPQLSLIFEGDIIVGASTLERGNEVAPFGFLRRVVNAFTDDQGQFIIETVPAALDEAVERGTQEVTVPIDFGAIYTEETLTTSFLPQEGVVPVSYAPPYAGLQVTIDHVVYDEDGNNSTTNDQVKARGWVKVEPGAQVQLDLDIKDHQLQSFHFLTTTQESARVELYSDVKVLSFQKTVPIKRFTFFPQTIFIGPIPVVITPQLTVYVGANGSVSVKVSTGIEQSSTITTGVSYENGKWTPVAKISDNHIGPLETKLTQSAQAGVFAGPELAVKIYTAAGPYGQIRGYLTLKADPSATPLWKLYGGIKGELGIKVEVLSFKVTARTIPVDILKEQILAQAGGGVTPPTNIPPGVQPTPSGPGSIGNTCGSIWWPPGCWPWWLWAVVILLAILILIMVFG